MKIFLYLVISILLFGGCAKNTLKTTSAKKQIIYPDCIPTANGDSECEKRARVQYQNR